MLRCEGRDCDSCLLEFLCSWERLFLQEEAQDFSFLRSFVQNQAEEKSFGEELGCPISIVTLKVYFPK